MNDPSSWFRFGPFVLREQAFSSDHKFSLAAGVGLFTPSWESRAVAFCKAGVLDVPQSRLLDFRVHDDAEGIVDKQRKKIADQQSNLVPIKLSFSTDIERNLHELRAELRALAGTGISSIFIEITSLPKAYIQSIVGWLLVEGLFPHVKVGYAEGIYQERPGAEALAVESVSFEAAKPMIGMAGPCREKRLIVVLGGERANCYALIGRMAPDFIHLLATKSSAHDELYDGISKQIEKIKIEYGDKVVQEQQVEAFSIQSFVDSLDLTWFDPRNYIANTLFAAGTKPHALAASVVAAAHKGSVELRFRRATRYAKKNVAWGGRYYLYDIVDLRSERLPECEIW